MTLADLPPLQIDDAFCEYSEEAWARVLATLSEGPGVDPNIRDQLEAEARRYR